MDHDTVMPQVKRPGIFHKSFTQQEGLPEAAVHAAIRVMRHGRLHRYNRTVGEISETALFESEFARWSGSRHCLAVTSGGYALSCALRALGIGTGEPVLTNAFTLAPVPGSIASIGAKPVFVESTPGLVIDLDDLQARIRSSGSRILLLSHMRGHICDMDRLVEICNRRDVLVVEDCAHTMGARWNDKRSGSHGIVACYSTQTYKHINSGEGGIITTDDDDTMARAVLLSGSYMFYDHHDAAPALDRYEELRFTTPNMSGRMDNLRASILRPQLENLDDQCREWNLRYRAIEEILAACQVLETIKRPEREHFVGSSIQFRLPGCDPEHAGMLVDALAASGVVAHWFGNENPTGYTSRYDSWMYCEPQACTATDSALADLFDMRIPLTFSLDECCMVAGIIADAATMVHESMRTM